MDGKISVREVKRMVLLPGTRSGPGPGILKGEALERGSQVGEFLDRRKLLSRRTLLFTMHPCYCDSVEWHGDALPGTRSGPGPGILKGEALERGSQGRSPWAAGGLPPKRTLLFTLKPW